ncbi:MAG: L-rhamnose mutarotase [Verrucomicrobiae bacterium]
MKTERRLYRRLLRPERIGEYRRHHEAVWPELEELYRTHGVTDLSCFLCGCELVVYQEIDPSVFLAAEAALAAHPVEIRWQALMSEFKDPGQNSSLFEEVYRIPNHL